MRKLIAKLVCAVKGHSRAVHVAEKSTAQARVVACPRCGHEKSYKVYAR